jgi:hypothetical protein
VDQGKDLGEDVITHVEGSFRDGYVDGNGIALVLRG